MSNTVYIGAKEYFPGIGKIGFEGGNAPKQISGRQEAYENLINQYLTR
ncbi:hypothetical protein [Xanthomonas oryzae]|nr:hypothetical protein [Xanthomonas oryzae]